MEQDLRNYRALSFDIFGTLVDWEAGLYPYLRPLIDQLPGDHPYATPFPTKSTDPTALAPKHPIFDAFSQHEAKIEAELPKLKHDTALEYAYRDLATELGVEARQADAARVASIYTTLVPFPDTVEAMGRLSKHFKLIGLSNVSNEGRTKVVGGPLKDVRFDAVYTAEDIGSYKPALDNFEYLLGQVESDFAIQKPALLHVAHGISTDHLTTEAIDIDHVWVERGTDNGRSRLDGMKRLRTVPDMKSLADQVDAAFDR